MLYYNPSTVSNGSDIISGKSDIKGEINFDTLQGYHDNLSKVNSYTVNSSTVNSSTSQIVYSPFSSAAILFSIGDTNMTHASEAN